VRHKAAQEMRAGPLKSGAGAGFKPPQDIRATGNTKRRRFPELSPPEHGPQHKEKDDFCAYPRRSQEPGIRYRPRSEG